MNRGDEMAANIKTGEPQSAGGAAHSDDRVNEQLRVAFKEFLRPSPQPNAAVALHEVLAEIARHLKNGALAIKTINDRLLAIENQTKKRSSRGFTRYLLAICIGAAATLAWQSYGETAKQMFASKASDFGWQLIANFVEQLGWTPPVTPETAAVRSSATETAAPVAQTAPDNITPNAADQNQLVREVTIPAAPAVPPGGLTPSENTQNTVPTSVGPPVGHAATDGALRASCGPDVKRLCGGISRENAGVIKCLNSHRMELSPICEAYFNAQKGVPQATSPNR
jgi:hypothetical protein